MPDPLPNREGRIGSGDRAYSLPHESWGTLALHPLVVIGAPTLVVICTSGQSEKDLSKLELLHVALQFYRHAALQV